jgi:hypothetical protein
MNQVEFVDMDGMPVHGLALLGAGGDIWVTFYRPWWDVASWLWYWLSPGKKAWTQVRKADNGKVCVRAVRVAKKHIRVSSVGK